MKHLVLIAATIAALATTLPVGGSALARDHDDDRRRSQSEREQERGRGPPDRREPQRRDLRDESDRRYEDSPGPARRGGYLPDRYRGGTVDDYQRFRLRPPPRGYAWVRVNGGFALVSVGDGRIFDVIPD